MGKKGKARAIASRVHQYVNSRRADRGISRLSGSRDLAAIAEQYAHEMAKRGRVGHSVDGSNPQDRGTGFVGVSENCAGGFGSRRSTGSIAEEAVGRWMQSRGHRQNILRKRSKIDGVGCWIRHGDVYLVHMFARRRSLL
jgi:uncharacterized protein YkwD